MCRSIPPLIVLVATGFKRASLLTVLRVVSMPLFGLIQAGPWFRSSMWHQLRVFLKYSVRLKLLAQLVIDRLSGKSK